MLVGKRQAINDIYFKGDKSYKSRKGEVRIELVGGGGGGGCYFRY